MSTETQAAEANQPKVRRRKEMVGTVVSAKMQKTVIVAVERLVKHRTYDKYLKERRKFSAHDTLGCQEGDRVLIKETRPISKSKRWRVSAKVAPDGKIIKE